MKKILAIIAVLITVSACSESEEEKAVNDIAEAMNQEREFLTVIDKEKESNEEKIPMVKTQTGYEYPEHPPKWFKEKHENAPIELIRKIQIAKNIITTNDCTNELLYPDWTEAMEIYEQTYDFMDKYHPSDSVYEKILIDLESQLRDLEEGYSHICREKGFTGYQLSE